ncbi:3-oxoacyl-[acyl-carrier-protein] reductase FabG [Caloramator mitchellensis]|uniref:3-oxoacyl-[acyl-carrier-protein] reductase n=1 Tax=Caloramator mitchellensis TaxID=908809 RepID=A0A0R3K3F6_CALMK|nr:3-oxoacyl-[acyl-carrier-protein] reductase [Caloramator mitchellensis]KRQ87868.1 3-oxoacyl-[acyl-carrier-protein] reductase FabG [Caloramator mitchellensis]
MLRGKIAIITGAAKGIGRDIAIKLAKEGADVVINYRTCNDRLKELENTIKEIGREVLMVQADVSNFDETKVLVEKCIEKFGKIDILVNNAGITRDNLIMRMTEDDFDDVYKTNLKGAFNLIKHAIPYMIKQKNGRIINISSVIGLIGNAGQANYAAAKAGLIGLTKSVAKEVASRNITVNAVAPGYIKTDMTDKLPEKIKEKMMEYIPLKRFGETEDVANLVAFLASENAAYITGQVINVDGGMVI